MMGSFTDNDENRFFDARDDTLSLASTSDSGSDCGDSFEINSQNKNWVSSDLSYEMWIRSPGSIQERRNKFMSWLELTADNSTDIDRITKDSCAVLQNLVAGDDFCSRRSSVTLRSNEAFDTSEALNLREASVFSINSNISIVGGDCNVDVLEGENHVISEEFEKKSTEKIKKGWLSKLLSFTCIVDREGDNNGVRGCDSARRVRVHQNKKNLKELSALYVRQDIKAHEGSILTMKFSLDGQYLASAGEDRVVHVWQVVEDNTSNQMNAPDIDPSCTYFTVNHLSELTPFPVDKEKIYKLKSLGKTSDSACVVFPPKVFRILEKPLHEFHGHHGEVLDLSWSMNNYLLSASIDKTVRLWRVGCDHCLKVFSHSDYVTCIQFNPVDEDYFISGSIDGKVRIWDIPGCQVVDWTDIKDIVTAVCFCPDAQGGILGSMRGNCYFYNISDNHLQLDSHISLQSKKKSLSKRITGFQFLPQDSGKVMVTCADSQVRILDGVNVISKYKSFRHVGNSTYASFTSDGKHIVSACEDSNVYIWNCINSKEATFSKPKNIRSCERFSANASIAIPWRGMKYTSSDIRWQVRVLNNDSPNTSLPLPSPACFSLSQEFCIEPFQRGSATWPEEKLPTTPSSSSIRKSQYNFLKASCQSTSNSHAWGMVIVTAGWDGRIRSFHNYGLPVLT